MRTAALREVFLETFRAALRRTVLFFAARRTVFRRFVALRAARFAGFRTERFELLLVAMTTPREVPRWVRQNAAAA
jgi:hypothetical protein